MTVVSILTTIGMTISTLVLALTGGSAPSSPGPRSNQVRVAFDSGLKQLQTIGALLAKLAEKAAAAIPSIIGSVVSWLLSTAGKALGWLAEHALLLAIVGLLLVAAQEWQSERKPKGN